MNHFRAIVLCSLAASLFSACGNSSKSGEYGYKELYSNASGITFDDFDIVELSEDVPLGSVRKIKIEDSLIFISTDESMYSFNMDGSLNATYGTQGRAANEYLYGFITFKNISRFIIVTNIYAANGRTNGGIN